MKIISVVSPERVVTKIVTVFSIVALVFTLVPLPSATAQEVVDPVIDTVTDPIIDSTPVSTEEESTVDTTIPTNDPASVSELSLLVPLTVCKWNNNEVLLSGWEMNISNGDGTIVAITGEDGCIETDLDPNDGPWLVTEEERAGWTQANVFATGPGSEVQSTSEVEGATEGCHFTLPEGGFDESTIEDSLSLAWGCDFYNQELETEEPPVLNSCFLPNTLGDTTDITILNSGEKTIVEMMAEHGYTIEAIADETNIQVWDLADPNAATITFNLRVLGKRAGNTQVLGYYKAGDGATYSAVLTQVSDTDGELAIPVTIPAAFASSFGFAIQSGDKIWYSETALNSDSKDHAAVYNPTANTYLIAFEDFDNLGDGDYNDIVIEISNVTCIRAVVEPEPEVVPASCIMPDTLGDTSPFTVLDSGETTVAQMLANHGYMVDPVTSQKNYQVWNITGTTTDTVTFNLRVLGKRAGNTQVLGYYKAGDSLTFTSVLTQVSDTDGELAIPVTIPTAFASSFGFAIQSGDKMWYSETALNSDGKDHVAVYNPVADTYILAFEDFDNLGDGDYSDLVMEVSSIVCQTASSSDNSVTPDDSTNSSSRRGGGGGTLTRPNPTPTVLGTSTSLDEAPEGLVLGEQVSVVPVGAPNAGAGGMSVTSIPVLVGALLTTRPRLARPS